MGRPPSTTARGSSSSSTSGPSSWRGPVSGGGSGLEAGCKGEVRGARRLGNSANGERRAVMRRHVARRAAAVRDGGPNTTAVVAGTSKTGVKYKGYVEIPNLSDENDVDEVEVSAAKGWHCWVCGCSRESPQGTFPLRRNFLR